MSVTDTELNELEKQINQNKAEETPASAIKPEPPQPEQEQKTPETPVESPPEQEVKDEKALDAKSFVEKKGWKTAEDAAKSYRELERAYHDNNQKKAEQQPMPAPAPQSWPQAPMQNYGYQPQAYQPPVNPYAPRITEEQVAASYGMSVEDFRRVAMLARDLSEAQTRQLEVNMQKKWEETNRQAEKSSDMASILSSPALQNSDVREEMHEVFTKNPELWNERKPYSAALKEALANLGLRSVTGGNRQATVQTTPPEMGGSKGAGGSLPGKRGLGAMPSVEEMKDKSLEEIEKTLRSNRVFRTHMDS